VNVHTFQVGPRFTAHTGRARIFGQLLLGAARASAGISATGGGASIAVSDSVTNFVVTPGVGVDFDLNNRFGLRAGTNFRFIRDSGDTNSEVQVIAGVVYRFGR
jgi:hypothetical protein